MERTYKAPPLVVWPLIAFVFFGLYVLSTGPMYAMYSNGYVDGWVYDSIYFPLHWLLRKTEPGPLVDAYEWYVLRWRDWFGSQPTPR